MLKSILEIVKRKEVIYVTIYDKNRHEDEREVSIDECDLRHMATQLLQLVHTYEEEVVIRDASMQSHLNNLKYIGRAIMKGQYELLMNDKTLVNLIHKEADGGNFYLDMTR